MATMDGPNHFSSYPPYSQTHSNQQHGLGLPSASSQQHPSQHSLGSFGNLSAHGHQQSSSSHATLPPLQNGSYSPFASMPYGSHPASQSQSQASSSSHTPVNTTGSAGYPHGSANGSSNAANPMMPPGFSNNFSAPPPLMYNPTSGATTMPPTSASIGLPTLRPMPAAGANGLPSLNSGAQLGNAGQQASFMQNEEAPTHVVGSQGRRGILPSAPGRPNPPAQGSAQATKSMIPQKDADGKFPCPHCNKTYLHAKHLKRHLLRHTGDRPYMCHLCKDTFSRSDILKRHFQKCSLRRGNPTGASHLAHQRRNTNSSNRLSISQQEGPVGLAGLPDVAGQVSYNGTPIANSPTVTADISARSSRANSIISPSSVNQRNGMSGLGILGQNGANGDPMVTTAAYQPGVNAYALQPQSSGAHMPNNYTFNAQTMNGNVYSHHSQQPMPFVGQPNSRFENHQSNSHPSALADGVNNGHSFDWTRMMPQGGQDGFVGSQPANTPGSQGASNIKSESAPTNELQSRSDFNSDSLLGDLYSHPIGSGAECATGTLPGFMLGDIRDPLHSKIRSLRDHCFPGGADRNASDALTNLMLDCLQLENVRALIQDYASFHAHWPILHMPTFRLADADNNLVLAMLCVGAVYSKQPGYHVEKVRQLMDFTQATIQKTAVCYRRFISGQLKELRVMRPEIQELQALAIMQTAFNWHGDTSQREVARADFVLLTELTKAVGICKPAQPGHPAYSPLHATPNSLIHRPPCTWWNWHAWLQQEERVRLFYHIWITEASMILFFNSLPRFDLMDIHLMLPSDDAAWEASSAATCANALGLNGPHGRDRALRGTCSPSQATLSGAIQSLLEPASTLQPGTTNVYAKFLIIHAVILRIIDWQRNRLQHEETQLSQSGGLNPRSDAQGDCLRGPNSDTGVHTAPVSTRAAKLSEAAHRDKAVLGQALEKWKSVWHMDLQSQYPRTGEESGRFGFTSDSLHFYYLGRILLQFQQPTDFVVPADVRVQRVMNLLKRIKARIMAAPGGANPADIIGTVADIDDQYGLDNITLDMKLLFKPLDDRLSRPVRGT